MVTRAVMAEYRFALVVSEAGRRPTAMRQEMVSVAEGRTPAEGSAPAAGSAPAVEVEPFWLDRR